MCDSKLGNHWFTYGLSAVRSQAIISANVDLLKLDPQEQTPAKCESKYHNFHEKKQQQKTPGNVCKIAVILPRLQFAEYVNIVV